eukprot:sb/3477640/
MFLNEFLDSTRIDDILFRWLFLTCGRCRTPIYRDAQRKSHSAGHSGEPSKGKSGCLVNMVPGISGKYTYYLQVVQQVTHVLFSSSLQEISSNETSAAGSEPTESSK